MRSGGHESYTLLDAEGVPRLEYRGKRLPVDDEGFLDGLSSLDLAPGGLPVILGLGSGRILDILAKRHSGPVAVVDNEFDVQRRFDARSGFPSNLDLVWIDSPDPDAVMAALEQWRLSRGSGPLIPLASPTWLKVRPRLYSEALRRVKAAMAEAGGRESAQDGRSRPPGGKAPRLLLVRFGYFLEREILAACGQLGLETATYSPREEGAIEPGAYVRGLLDAVRRSRPDWVLTVNSLGADYSGGLFGMLERMGVGYATWFVDSPELFLHGSSDLSASKAVFFSCDPDHEAKLGRLVGFRNVHYLPLAADETRFDLETPIQSLSPRLKVSFIGTTWVDKLAATHRNFRFSGFVLRGFRQAAKDMVERPSDSVADFLEQRHPEFWAACRERLDLEEQKGLFHLLCWEANRIYRQECVGRLMDFAPLVAGDRHWARFNAAQGGRATLHPEIGYYTPDLLEFYRLAAVNFNCGGIQMPRAVNQRVFDAPGAGGFLLTDRRDQLAECFEPGIEAACYDSPDEIGDAVARWLADDPGRLRVVNAARKRIRAEHTYRHRIKRMVEILWRS